MVSLGVTNSRMKDFYDLRRLAASAEFDGPTLARAIRATFERRKVLAAFERLVRAKRELLALLQKTAEQDEEMLAAMGGAGA